MLFWWTVTCASALICCILYISAQISFPKRFGPYIQDNIAKWLLTILQNLISFPLAIYCLLDWSNRTKAIDYVTAIVMGHAIFDFLWWLLMYRKYNEHPEWTLFVHHILIAVACLFECVIYGEQARDFGQFYIVIQILHEGSSPFISIYVIMKLLQYKGWWHKVNVVVLNVTFWICHNVVNVYCVGHMLWNYGEMQNQWVASIIIVVCVMLNSLLSIAWTIAFMRSLRKLFRKTFTS